MSEQIPKRERYFSGMPLQQDPAKPIPGELPPESKARFLRLLMGVGLLGLGVLVGLALAPEAPSEALERVAQLEAQVQQQRARIVELERSLAYAKIEVGGRASMLSASDRARHEQIGARYVAQVRKAGAQPASDVIAWFIHRWNELLDKPETNDRIKRRAETLSQLVGGMARNLDPGDFIPWQAEFFDGSWLGELHFDLDGDGLPGPRSRANPGDGFTDMSVCHVAMALNQTVDDAQVLVTPEMRCDAPNAKISVFLQGRTLDDALNEFVRALQREGFRVKESAHQSQGRSVRLIMVGPKSS